MLKKITNRIVRYFKDMFSDDIGEYNPMVKEVDAKVIVQLIIGLVLCYFIPACLVWIEVGAFDWIFFRLIWGESSEMNFRGLYAIFGMCTVISFTLLGCLSPYRINGKAEIGSWKPILRICWIVCLAITITAYIISLIIY